MSTNYTLHRRQVLLLIACFHPGVSSPVNAVHSFTFSQIIGHQINIFFSRYSSIILHNLTNTTTTMMMMMLLSLLIMMMNQLVADDNEGDHQP